MKGMEAMRRKKEVLKYAPDVDSALHIIERSGTISGHELCYRRERLLLEQMGKFWKYLITAVMKKILVSTCGLPTRSVKPLPSGMGI